MLRSLYWTMMSWLHRILVGNGGAAGSVKDYKRIQFAADTRTVMAVQKWVDDRQYCAPDKTMAQVADDIGVSSEQLSRYCRHMAGRPFLTWRKHLRVNDAKSILLENPEMSITQVGELVGIYDKTNFRKQFYEVMRCTPQEWRKRNLPNRSQGE